MYPRGYIVKCLRVATLAGVSILAAAGLSGCVAALPRTAPAPVVEQAKGYAVPVSVKPNLGVTITLATVSRFIPAWGITTSNMDGTPVEVQFDADMARYPALARMVAAHEFGHVLGIGAHDHNCPWMKPSLDRTVGLVPAPCEEMVIRAKARSAGKVYTLVIEAGTEPAFVDAFLWAAARWNEALGRGALVVRTAPPVVYAPDECADGSCRIKPPEPK